MTNDSVLGNHCKSIFLKILHCKLIFNIEKNIQNGSESFEVSNKINALQIEICENIKQKKKLKNILYIQYV